MTDSTPGTPGAHDLPTPPPPPTGGRPPGRHTPAYGTPAVGASRPTPDSPPAPDGPPAPELDSATGPTADPEPESGPAAATDQPPSRRRNLIVAAVAAGVVVVVALVVAALAGAFGGSEPTAVPSATTVTLTSPTPTVPPAARTPISAFADALPSTVLNFALASVAQQPPLVAGGALEGYLLTFSDGGKGTVTVEAGQFETPVEAAAAYNAMVTALPPAPAAPPAGPTPTAQATPSAPAVPATGPVQVGGQPVGAWTVATAADGTGVAVWTNGTALFRAVGPAATVKDFYAAFPL